MDYLIIFTHIPKTAGTSFIKTVVEPNVSGIYRYQGMRKFVLDNRSDQLFVKGHCPYGLHLLSRNKHIQYITFLRDPVERAISYYYFIKDSDTKLYKHPLRDYADSVTLKEFYENKNFQNLQTRFIAGLLQHSLYSKIQLKKIVLKSAKQNLSNFYFYGISEQFEQSVEKIRDKFAWEKVVEFSLQKKTQKRPLIENIDKTTLLSLNAAHDLDWQLYNFAVKHFEEQK
jgi:hypothetical protein